MNVTLLSAGSLGPAQSPTLNITGAATAQTVLVFCTGPVTLDVDGPASTAGWVRDYYKVNTTGFAIFRLPAVNNGGGSLTLKITTNGPRNLAYVAVQGNIGAPAYGNFGSSGSGWTNERSILSGTSIMATDVHTFAQAAHAFAVFPLVNIDSGDATLDITSYDQSYTELGDSGITPPDANEESRLWVAYKSTTSMSNNGVTATTNQNAVTTTIGWHGMAAYALDYPVTITDSGGNELTAYVKTGSGLTLLRPNLAP